MERKIEAALEAYFRFLGDWDLYVTKDHYAECHEDPVINLTECAKRIAEEIKC